MPTVLFLKGWLKEELWEIQTAFTDNLTESDMRFIRKTLYQHFDEFIDSWYDFKRELDDDRT